MPFGSRPIRKKFFRSVKSSGVNTFQWCAKVGNRGIGRFRIGRGSANEKVQILRKPGLCVVDNREANNYQVFNAMGVEGGQKVFVVFVHPVLSSNLSARKQPRSSLAPRPAVHARADFANNDIHPP